MPPTIPNFKPFLFTLWNYLNRYGRLPIIPEGINPPRALFTNCFSSYLASWSWGSSFLCLRTLMMVLISSQESFSGCQIALVLRARAFWSLLAQRDLWRLGKYLASYFSRKSIRLWASWQQIGSLSHIIINLIYPSRKSMQSSKNGTETRGRPKKEEARTLAPLYKEIFSDNSAIIHTSFLIYVFEVFIETKTEKRVGHKDGGFTIYDKIDSEYCFDNLDDYLKAWGYNSLLTNHNMRSFVRILPALGPKLILSEILKLLDSIARMAEGGRTEGEIVNELTIDRSHQNLDLEFPYMRFVPAALKQLKLEKLDREDENKNNAIIEIIKQRVRYLWEPLIKITIHTVLNSMEGKVHNKYFKPFFSDAENPHDTYIGQLNLDQIISAVEKNEIKVEASEFTNGKKSLHKFDSVESVDRLKKVRSIVDPDGQRQIVQIIRAPAAVKVQSSMSAPVSIPSPIIKKQSDFRSQSVLSVSAFKPKPATNNNSLTKLQKKVESDLVNVLKQAFRDEQELDEQNPSDEKQEERDAQSGSKSEGHSGSKQEE